MYTKIGSKNNSTLKRYQFTWTDSSKNPSGGTPATGPVAPSLSGHIVYRRKRVGNLKRHTEKTSLPLLIQEEVSTGHNSIRVYGHDSINDLRNYVITKLDDYKRNPRTKK